MRLSFQKSMMFDAFWMIAIFIAAPVALFALSYSGASLFLPGMLETFLLVALAIGLVPILIVIRTLKNWRKRVSELRRQGISPGSGDYLRAMLHGLAIILLPTIVWLLIAALRSPIDFQRMQFLFISLVALWTLICCYALSIFAASLMRTTEGMFLAAYFTMGCLPLLPNWLYIFGTATYPEVAPSMITVLLQALQFAGGPLCLLLAVISARWRTREGFIGTYRFRTRACRVVRRIPPLNLVVSPDLAMAATLWLLFALGVPLAAYALVRWEYPGLDRWRHLPFIDGVALFRSSVLWSSIATAIFIAWLGIRLGRLGRVRQTSLFFRRRLRGVQWRFSAHLILAAFVCAAVTALPASVFSHLVDQWIQAPVGRPSGPGVTWIPDFNMLAAKGDAVMLRRYQVPAAMWVFILGAAAGWITRYRVPAMIAVLVASSISTSSPLDQNTQLSIVETNLTLAVDSAWWTYATQMLGRAVAVAVAVWALVYLGRRQGEWFRRALPPVASIT